MRAIGWTVLLIACAGRTPTAREPGEPGAYGGQKDGRALTPEEWERVDTTIRQKKDVLNRCYAEELGRLKDRNFAGDVTLNIRITTEGRASDVQVVDSTLKSEVVERCLADEVRQWDFSAVSADAWFMYTFHFEPKF